LEWYYDGLPTNCVSWWFCPGCTGKGYPKYAYKPEPEYGYYNLAVFYGACSYDCLFCQNWHYRNLSAKHKPVMSAEALAQKAFDKRVSCVCFFGGDPSPQMPHSLETSRIALEKAEMEKRILRVCWETNGYMKPRLAEKAAEYALKSGGNIKFDLKAWSEPLAIAATLDTLGRTLAVKLQEYSMPQVKDIIAYRAEEAFTPGAVGEDIVDFIAYISKRYGGIRYALELLLEAGVIAERQGFSRVGVSEVRMAHAAIPKGVNGAFYPEELSVQKQVLLKSIMGKLDATSEPFVTLEDTQTNYAELCNHYSIKPEDEKTLLKYLEGLETEKYILLWKKGQEVKIGIEYPFHQLEEAINKSLEHELQRYKSAVVH
jgi:pyruvate-formate lyase-activating enzyme